MQRLEDRILWASHLFKEISDITLIKIKTKSADFAFSFNDVAVSQNVYVLAKVTDEHPLTLGKIFSVEETKITLILRFSPEFLH